MPDETEDLRSLDARIAVEVMGWTDVNTLPGPEPTATNGLNPDGERGRVPLYSTDIAEAWKVVDAMCERGYSMRLANNSCASSQNAVAFQEGWKGLGDPILDGPFDDKNIAVESTIPLAIVRAALAAVAD